MPAQEEGTETSLTGRLSCLTAFLHAQGVLRGENKKCAVFCRDARALLVYTLLMPVTLELPPEILAAYGDELERKVLESLLLQMVREGRLSVAKAGSLLGLDRLAAIRWYTSHGYTFPNYDAEDFVANDLNYARKP